MSSHIPNRGEQMVRYYGCYSNVSRGKRQKEGIDDTIPCILEPLEDEKIMPEEVVTPDLKDMLAFDQYSSVLKTFPMLDS